MSWGDRLVLQGFGGRVAVFVIWVVKNPRDGTILGHNMVPCVVERARSISREPEHRRRRELPLTDGACFELCGNVGGIAVAVT